MSTPPSPSRPPPPQVPPVEHAGVRYEQDQFGPGDQPGGYLAATDAATGARLWRVKVYEVAASPGAPTTMPRYFRSMRLAAGGAALEIEDERGGAYRVDLATQAVTRTN